MENIETSKICKMERETKKNQQTLLCPYYHHVVTYVDYAFHLSKCRKNDPENSVKFQVCAYDRRHHVAIEDMESHLKECTSRQSLLLRQISEGRADPEEQIRQLSIRRAKQREKTIQP